MRRMSGRLLLVSLSCFAVGCGGGAPVDAGPDLQVQENLDADMAEQAKMAAEAAKAK